MSNHAIIYRKAKLHDFPAILKIASIYYKDRPQFDPSYGFLSSHLTESLLNELNQNAGILVAEQHGSILGFLILSLFSKKLKYPEQEILINSVEKLKYKNKLITHFKLFLFGPICILPSARGLGIFKGLYRTMWAYLPFEKFQCGVASISKNDTYSLDIHCKGLHANVIGEYSIDDSSFWIIAYHRDDAKFIALD